jgi:regulator of sigma E protease
MAERPPDDGGYMLLTIAAFIFVLSVVVFVHEAGHFIAAKLNGIYVVTFSIGFGPKILKKRIGETEYAISALPFGGYVKMAGETENMDSDSPEKDELLADIPEDRFYRSKNPWQRISVVLAGPFMNALLAIILFVMSIWTQGVFIANPRDIIVSVTADSPAESAGFMPGDVVLSVNGESIEAGKEISDLVTYDEDAISKFVVLRVTDTLEIDVSPAWHAEEERLVVGIFSYSRPIIGDVKRDGAAYDAGMRSGAMVVSVNDTIINTYIELEQLIHARLDVPLDFVWVQNGDTISATITPEGMDAAKDGEKLDVIQVGAIGITEHYEKEMVGFAESVRLGSRAYKEMFLGIMLFLKKLFSGQASIRAVGGPLRVGVMVGEMVRWGFNYLINFIAFFSLNLAIFNLLPILPFDGGHFVIFLVEGLTGRKPSPKVEEIMGQVGFIVLIALMAFIFAIDIFNIFGR